jgi:hypothetical protein
MPPVVAPIALVIVLALAGNAFGIRRRQGRAYVSAFEATQAYGTVQLAVLRLLVKSVCVLAALTTIGVSVWVSLPLLGDAVFVQMWSVPLSSQRSALNVAVAALTGFEQLALAVVATVGVGVWVASWAALGALWTRYSRRVNIAAVLLLLYGLALALLALAAWRGIGPGIPVSAIIRATSWVAASAMLLAAGYLLWQGVAENLLTMRQAFGLVVPAAGFGAAWVILLRAAGLSLTGMSAGNVASMLSPVLLTLMVSALAPWSLSRVRHT